MAQPQTLGRRGGNRDSLVIDCEDGVERCSTMEGHDGLNRGVASSERHDDSSVAHGSGQGLAMLGSDHDVDTQASGRTQEVRGPVGGRRQQQEDPGHGPRMVSSTQTMRRGQHT